MSQLTDEQIAQAAQEIPLLTVPVGTHIPIYYDIPSCVYNYTPTLTMLLENTSFDEETKNAVFEDIFADRKFASYLRDLADIKDGKEFVNKWRECDGINCKQHLLLDSPFIAKSLDRAILSDIKDFLATHPVIAADLMIEHAISSPTESLNSKEGMIQCALETLTPLGLGLRLAQKKQGSWIVNESKFGDYKSCINTEDPVDLESIVDGNQPIVAINYFDVYSGKHAKYCYRKFGLISSLLATVVFRWQHDKGRPKYSDMFFKLPIPSVYIDYSSLLLLTQNTSGELDLLLKYNRSVGTEFAPSALHGTSVDIFGFVDPRENQLQTQESLRNHLLSLSQERKGIEDGIFKMFVDGKELNVDMNNRRILILIPSRRTTKLDRIPLTVTQSFATLIATLTSFENSEEYTIEIQDSVMLLSPKTKYLEVELQRIMPEKNHQVVKKRRAYYKLGVLTQLVENFWCSP